MRFLLLLFRNRNAILRRPVRTGNHHHRPAMYDDDLDIDPPEPSDDEDDDDYGPECLTAADRNPSLCR